MHAAPEAGLAPQMPGGAPAGAPERLGVLGGTFDPPHCGHVAAALACRRQLALDRVLLMVANDPWQKAPSRHITPAADRLALVEAATRGLEGVEASALEIERGGPSYTVDTVQELRQRSAEAGRPAPELFVAVGADLVPTLDTWERAAELRLLVTLVVVSRPHSQRPLVPPGWRWVEVDGGGVDVSSSELRHRLATGAPVEGLMPEPVVRCILRRGLYAVR